MEQMMQLPLSQGKVQYFDHLSTFENYWHYSPYDLDPLDRPTLLPHTNYGKFMYHAQVSSPAVPPKDWESACPSYITESEHKGHNPLNTIDWI